MEHETSGEMGGLLPFIIIFGFIALLIISAFVSCQPKPEPLPEPTPDTTQSGYFALYWPYMSAGGPKTPMLGVAAAEMGKTLSVICPESYDFRKVWGIGQWDAWPCPRLEHIPMLSWGIGTNPATVAQNTRYLDNITSQHLSYYRIFYNECEAASQCNADPSLAAEHYGRIVQEYLSRGGHIEDVNTYWVLGGVNFQSCGIRWLEIFFQAYESLYGTKPPFGVVHFHAYMDIKSVNPDCPVTSRTWVYAPERLASGSQVYWEQYFEPTLDEAIVGLRALTDKPLWITEVGCLHSGCYGQFTLDLENYFSVWLDDNAYEIDRVAWYTDNDENYNWGYTELVDPIMQVLTQLGAQYFSVEAYP